MNYSDKLKDPRWQKKRLEILERDDFKCVYCENKKDTLHVHHLIYLKNNDPWDYPDNLLYTLCNKCHHFIKDFDFAGELIKYILNGADDEFLKLIIEMPIYWAYEFMNCTCDSIEEMHKNYLEEVEFRKNIE